MLGHRGDAARLQPQRLVDRLLRLGGVAVLERAIGLGDELFVAAAADGGLGGARPRAAGCRAGGNGSGGTFSGGGGAGSGRQRRGGGGRRGRRRPAGSRAGGGVGVTTGAGAGGGDRRRHDGRRCRRAGDVLRASRSSSPTNHAPDRERRRAPGPGPRYLPNVPLGQHEADAVVDTHGGEARRDVGVEPPAVTPAAPLAAAARPAAAHNTSSSSSSGVE